MSMMIKLPIGRRVNSSPVIYKQGGSFCKKCRIEYDFDETLHLLKKAKNKKTTGPRCEYCDKLVTTGRGGEHGHTFWNLMRKLGSMKP
jgi:hypothetical protein